MESEFSDLLVDGKLPCITAFEATRTRRQSPRDVSDVTTYCFMFLGYIMTSIHPCIPVSLEYFRTSLSEFIGRLAVPTAAASLITLAVSLLVL